LTAKIAPLTRVAREIRAQVDDRRYVGSVRSSRPTHRGQRRAKPIEQEPAMPSKLRQSLIIVASIVAVAFVIAGSERHAQHGANAVIGAVAWFTFLPGLLVLVALGVAAVATVARNARVARRGQR
jgi:hypothetical protein